MIHQGSNFIINVYVTHFDGSGIISNNYLRVFVSVLNFILPEKLAEKWKTSSLL